MTEDNESFEGRDRGRPKTGVGVKVGTRIAPALRARVQQWADDNLTDFGDAVRQLLERGLDK